MQHEPQATRKFLGLTQPFFTRKNLKKMVPLALTVFVFAGAISTAVLQRRLQTSQDPSGQAAGPTINKWEKLELTFPTGISVSEGTSNPNPFLDFRMEVTFSGPGGGTYQVPGYFAGNGSGGETGDNWRVRFTPPTAGAWNYTAVLKKGESGKKIAINLNEGGETVYQSSDSFTVLDQVSPNQGFFSKGWLQHNNKHYPQFSDGTYFLKTGADSPENFLAFAGFDNTHDVQGGWLHNFNAHAGDWAPGDPTFGSNPTLSKNIIGAINYLSNTGVNSIYIIPNTLGGDGWDSYPFVSAENSSEAKSHYDVSKLDQWQIVLEHAQRKGVMAHLVFSELGTPNWWGSDSEFSDERKLFFREMIARFGYLPAVTWNVGEEISDMNSNLLRSMGQYIVDLDWVNRPTTFHTRTNDINKYDPMFGSGQPFNTASVQFDVQFTSSHAENIWAESTSTGKPWIIGMDEITLGAGPDNFEEMRKRVLYHTLFSGGMVEWYVGFRGFFPNDVNLEDFRVYEELYKWTSNARKIMEQNVPYWDMIPDDGLAVGEPEFHTGAQIFSKRGSFYLVYYPITNAGGNGTLNLTHAAGKNLKLKWFDVKTGQQAGSTKTIDGGSTIDINAVAPPPTQGIDWVLLATDDSFVPPVPPPPGPPGGGDSAWLEKDGIIVIEAESGDNPPGWVPTTEIPYYTGDHALTWTGGDFIGLPNIPLAGKTDFKLYIDDPGTYHIRVRNYHDFHDENGNPDNTQENDMWTKVDDGDWVKVYSNTTPVPPPNPENTWNWQTTYEFTQTNKYPAKVDFDQGYHTFSYSGRANGFTIDRIYIFKDGVLNDTDWRFLKYDLPESVYGPPGTIAPPPPPPVTKKQCNEFCTQTSDCKDGLVCHQTVNTIGAYHAISDYNLPNSNEVRQIAVRGDYIYARTVNPVTNSYPPFELVPLSSNWYDLHHSDPTPTSPARKIASIASYNIGGTGEVRQIVSVLENDQYDLYYRNINPSTNSYPDFTNEIAKTDKWFAQTGTGPIRAIGTYNMTPFSNEVKQIIIRGTATEPRLYHRIINTATNSYPDFVYISDRSNDWYTGTGTGDFIDIAASNINGSNKVRQMALRHNGDNLKLSFKDATPVLNQWPRFADITAGSDWMSQTVFRVCRAEACTENAQCSCAQ